MALPETVVIYVPLGPTVVEVLTGPPGPPGVGQAPDPIPLISKGDIYTFNGAAAARLPVGSNGQVLVADSTATTGLKYATATGTGDMLAANNLSDVASASTSRANLGVPSTALAIALAVAL